MTCRIDLMTHLRQFIPDYLWIGECSWESWSSKTFKGKDMKSRKPSSVGEENRIRFSQTTFPENFLFLWWNPESRDQTFPLKS